MLNKIKKYFTKETIKMPVIFKARTLADICECTGEIPIKNITGYVTLGLESGQHTGTIIQKCLKCNCLSGFPNDNLLWAIKEGNAETLEFLNKINEHI